MAVRGTLGGGTLRLKMEFGGSLSRDVCPPGDTGQEVHSPERGKCVLTGGVRADWHGDGAGSKGPPATKESVDLILLLGGIVRLFGGPVRPVPLGQVAGAVRPEPHRPKRESPERAWPDPVAGAFSPPAGWPLPKVSGFLLFCLGRATPRLKAWFAGPVPSDTEANRGTDLPVIAGW